MALAYGFAGLRDHAGRISFRPRLPEEWKSLGFSLTIRGTRIRVEIDHGDTIYRLVEGDGIRLLHDGDDVILSAEKPVACRPTPPCPATEPRPGPGAADPACEP